MSLLIIKGAPALSWGTGGTISDANAANGLAGAVVDSLQITPKNSEPIDIEGNNGITTNLVLLVDGFNAKITTMFDSTKVYPVEGANANITIGYSGANTTNIPFGAGNGANYNANTVTYTVLVASISPAYKKKGEYMIDFNLVYRPNVAV